MSNMSPKAEPIAWGTIAGLVIAAVASYGLNITPELKELLIAVVPIVAGLVWARSKVTAPDTLENVKQEEYAAGLDDAQPSPEAPRAPLRTSIPQGQGVSRFTRPGV